MATSPRETLGGHTLSSATLVDGVRTISHQNSGLLMKTEEDEALAMEYAVA